MMIVCFKSSCFIWLTLRPTLFDFVTVLLIFHVCTSSYSRHCNKVQLIHALFIVHLLLDGPNDPGGHNWPTRPLACPAAAPPPGRLTGRPPARLPRCRHDCWYCGPPQSTNRRGLSVRPPACLPRCRHDSWYFGPPKVPTIRACPSARPLACLGAASLRGRLAGQPPGRPY